MIAGESKKSSGKAELVGVPVPTSWTVSRLLSVKASAH